uniref:Uncharacterized protein n=1 Tax=Siphoviridae sp. ctDuC3 TaxID=2827563 RepID=A0A8S5LMZ2_9CAUD|nr:MAG TPA: hypothetical protein [Siphoviridae sp. ctDuC3]
MRQSLTSKTKTKYFKIVGRILLETLPYFYI